MEDFTQNGYSSGNLVNQYKIGDKTITIYNLEKNNTKITNETSNKLKIYI